MSHHDDFGAISLETSLNDRFNTHIMRPKSSTQLTNYPRHIHAQESDIETARKLDKGAISL